MKQLKLYAVLMLAVVLFSACEDETNMYVNQLYTDAQKNLAITTCLNSSVDSAVAHLCTYDGFYAYQNGNYRLDFSTLQSSLFDTLSNHNYGYLKDTLILRANRLAESCAANATTTFKDAISDLKIDNPDNLFYGEDGSITDFFKLHEYENLKGGLQAPVAIRMSLFNVSNVWNEMLQQYNSFTSTPINFDIQNYIVTSMVDGLLEEMRIEESLIRSDSAHRVSGDSILGR